MGIACEIRLFPSENGNYEYTPGGVVSGSIKWFLADEVRCNKITLSLKGAGRLRLDDKRRQRKNRRFKYYKSETYVDEDHVIYSNVEQGAVLMTGHLETPFTFKLPADSPPSLALFTQNQRYRVWCFIEYYVRIKFEKPGVFNFSKHFKRGIIVKSVGTPRLETYPLTYSNVKSVIKLSTLFSSKKDKVNVKGTILTSVVRPKDDIKLKFQIENSTSVNVKAVKIKLVEVNKFMPKGHYDVDIKKDIDGADFVHGYIQAGVTKNIEINIPVPANCGSVNYSKLFARDYSVRTIVVLPMPHSNLVLDIPVQIVDGSSQEYNASFSVSTSPTDDPPTYWEAMGEDAKGTIHSEFDELEKEHE